MTTGVVLGIVTVAMLIAFIAIVVWAWRPARRADFAQAAALALREDTEQPR